MPKNYTVVIDARSKIDIKKSVSRKPVASKKKSKGRKGKGRKGKGKGSGIFSGRVLGIQVPGARGVLGNKILQKVLVGAGAVSVGLSLVQLINNPTLNKFASRKEVRIGAAAVAGDIPGAAFQFFKEDGITKISGVMRGQTSSVQQIGQGEGLA